MNPSKPSTVAEYINAAPSEAQGHLKELLVCLREVSPDATEELKWGTPAFSYERILFTAAAHKHHVSLHPTPAAIRAFASELSSFKTSEGTIQFPFDEPLPVELIRDIAAYRVKDCQENDARWM